MFSFNKQVFIVLLSFNDEPCFVRPTLIDVNPIEVKYYPFMIR